MTHDTENRPLGLDLRAVADRLEESTMPRTHHRRTGSRRIHFRPGYLGLVAIAVLAVGCPTAGVPTLSLSQLAFSFQTDLRTDAVTLTNTGGGTITWSVDPSSVPAWLDVTPTQGSFSTDVQTVTMNLNSTADTLGPGTFQAQIAITSDGGGVSYAVSLRVTTGADLIVEPATLDFAAIFETAVFTIRNGGSESLDWEITDIDPSDSFIVIDPPTMGTLSNSQETANVEVRVNRDGLEAGEITGSITISSDAGTATVEIRADVLAEVARLSVSPAVLDIETTGFVTENISIRNEGVGTITWTILDDLPAWLSIDTLTDTAESETDRVTLQANATALDPGTYEHTLSISAVDGANADAGISAVLITLVVPEPVPELAVTPLEIDLGDTDSEDFIQIRNPGTGQLDWMLTIDVPWISLVEGEPTEGSLTTNNEIIEFRVDRSSLTPGPQQGTITVSSNAGTATVAIRLDVLPPTLQVVPRFLNFSTNFAEKQFAIFNQGTGTVNWQIDVSGLPSWLSIETSTAGNENFGTLAGEETTGVLVVVDRTGLEPGPYTFDAPGILVESDGVGGSDIGVEILMEVSENPVLGIDTGRSALDNTPNVDLDNIPFVPVAFDNDATFLIANLGTGSLSWQIDDLDFPDWLSIDVLGPAAVEPDDGPFEITVSIARGELNFGPYNHRIFVQSNDDSNELQPIDIQMNVPKRVVVFATPPDLDFGTTLTTLEMLAANFGDPDTILNFGISSNKNWLFAFPEVGRSIGVVNPQLNADFQRISVSIDRTGLDGAGGGTGILTVFALATREDEDDIDNDGDTNEVIQVRDDSIAPPFEVEVAVQAAELFFESPPARLRVPSLVRYISTMRNLRFESIPLPDEDLPEFENNFFISESDVPLEIAETNQFLTSSSLLTNDVVIMLDYSGSAFESAMLAQQFHESITDRFMEEFPDAVLPDLTGFETAADPLQFMYEACIGQLLDELPSSHNISIMEIHDRNQSSRVIIGFTPNEGAGHDALQAALEGINITDHGATEMTDALVDATFQLAAENSPVPSTGAVIPVNAFDDADLRTILMFTDGRVTSGFLSITDAFNFMKDFRVRLLGVAWGNNFNAGPLATISAETGGHVYVTRSLDTGEDDGAGVPVRAPSIYTMFDWCDTDSANDACDLSIGKDVRSEIVLSYVSLSVMDAVEGRVSASFDDPNDGNETISCQLPDQGDIAGEFTQELPVGSVIGFDDFNLGVNLGQIALESHGIDADDQAVLYAYVDYMPRDVRQLEFLVAANNIGTILTSVSPVGMIDGGFFENDWTLEQLGNVFVDPTTGLDAFIFRVDTNGDPMQYGAFGRLLRFDFDVPGGAPFTFRLVNVVPTTGNNAQRVFSHPDGILINNANFKAPSLPTPRVTPTIIDFGTTSTVEFFTVDNVGGSYAPGNIFLDWSIIGDSTPDPFVTVTPSFGRLISTDDQFVVRVNLNRDKPQTGPITDIRIFFEYETGIIEIGGLINIVVTGTILPPVLSVFSPDFPMPTNQTLNFGTAAATAPAQVMSFFVANSGQSTMLWFRQDANPDTWLTVTDATSVTEEFPQEVFVTVNRMNLAPGSTNSHVIDIIATTFEGSIVGATSVTVLADVSP